MRIAPHRLAPSSFRRLVSGLAGAAILLQLTACGGGVPVEFDVPLETETTVEGAGVLEQLLTQFGFEDFSSFDLSDSQQWENNDVRKENVTDVRLTVLKLEVTAPSDGNLDFLDEIDFYAEAPEQERTHVAGGEIPDGEQEVDLPIEDVNLAPFVKAETMTLDTEVSGRRPEEDTTVKATANFHVTAEVDAALVGEAAAEQ